MPVPNGIPSLHADPFQSPSASPSPSPFSHSFSPSMPTPVSADRRTRPSAPGTTMEPRNAFAASGRAFGAAFHPFTTSVAAYTTLSSASITDHGPKLEGNAFEQDKAVHFARYGPVEEAAFKFYADASIVFESVQKISTDDPTSTTFKGKRSGRSIFEPPPSVKRNAPQPPDPHHAAYYSRAAGLYLDSLRRFLAALEAAEDGPDVDAIAHVQSLFMIFMLAQTLYLPEDGIGSGPVGEELLHWVNMWDPSPTTEEGEEVMSAPVPYKHPKFEHFVLTALVRGFHRTAMQVFQTLTEHRSTHVADLARSIMSLLDSFPRQTSHLTDNEIVLTYRSWRERVHKVRLEVEPRMGQAHEETIRHFVRRKGREPTEAEYNDLIQEPLDIEAQFNIILELLWGREERVLDACNDWREALACWALYVKPNLRRDEIPTILSVITKNHPIDRDDPIEAIQAALVEGEIDVALSRIYRLDKWLAAHLADLADKMKRLDPDLGFDVSLRDYFILEFSDLLSSDSDLWKINAGYLSHVEHPTGRARMSELIRKVPLLLGEDETALKAGEKGKARLEAEERMEESVDESMVEVKSESTTGWGISADREGSARGGRATPKTADVQGFKRVEEVLRVCMQHEMEDEAKEVCKMAAETLVLRREYGQAVAYCVRATDAVRVGRIADLLLDEYVEKGPEEFVSLVNTIPTSLLDPRERAKRPDLFVPLSDLSRRSMETERIEGSEADESEEARVFATAQARRLFSSRLYFLSRYRDFLELRRAANEGRKTEGEDGEKEGAGEGIMRGGLVGRMGTGDKRKAASLLVVLLTSDLAPRRFWAVLLVDALPLLRDKDILFNTEETYDLLRILEDIVTASEMHRDEAWTYLGTLERILAREAGRPKGSRRRANGDGHGDGVGGRREEPAGAEAFDEGRKRMVLKKLDEVRLALAAYLARASVNLV